MAKLSYREIAKAKIKDSRNVVISETYNADEKFIGYSVSEQLIAEESGRETKVFLRGGLGIISEEGLIALHNALQAALIEEGVIKELSAG